MHADLSVIHILMIPVVNRKLLRELQRCLIKKIKIYLENII